MYRKHTSRRNWFPLHETRVPVQEANSGLQRGAGSGLEPGHDCRNSGSHTKYPSDELNWLGFWLE